MQRAMKMATGAECNARVLWWDSSPSAPFFKFDEKFGDRVCTLASVPQESTCSASSDSQGLRLGPAPTTRRELGDSDEQEAPTEPSDPEEQEKPKEPEKPKKPEEPSCIQLKGRMCPGTDLDCNCNYCDDFQPTDSRCANACRVLNGYKKSPLSSSNWKARQNRYPRDALPRCNCQWMKGTGDDCRNCDTCAYLCRKANPGMTCH